MVFPFWNRQSVAVTPLIQRLHVKFAHGNSHCIYTFYPN